MSIQDYIGKTVKYFDFLGLERYGTILTMEPCTVPSNDPVDCDNEDNLFYIYIVDEEPEMNIHDIFINGKYEKYAEIRISTEVYLDER